VVAAVVVLVALVGAVLVLSGLWWVYPPSALIAGGIGAGRLAYVVAGMSATEDKSE